MHPDKASGADGMTVGFFKKYWPIRGYDAIKVILGFLNNGEQLKEINHTNIVLIPKIKNPSTPKGYRPISLCNVVYKLISKVFS